MPFKEVPTKVDFPAQERDLLGFWKETGAFRKLTRSSPARPALVVHRRSDHRQQPDGRAPRLGAHLQRPVPPLLDHARPQDCATRTASTARACGSRSKSRKRWASRARKTSKTTAWRNSCASARRASCATPPCRPSSPSAWAIGWTGTTPTSCAGWLI